jgi:hypothetical protein
LASHPHYNPVILAMHSSPALLPAVYQPVRNKKKETEQPSVQGSAVSKKIFASINFG